MNKVYGTMKVEYVFGDSKYVRLIEDFPFYSERLGKQCIVPKGFVHDNESVPLVRGSNNEAGCIHDYFSRKDSVPVVTAKVAAKIYRDFQEYFDEMESGNFFNRIWDYIKRAVKVFFVRYFTMYFHKHNVMDTYSVVKGKK